MSSLSDLPIETLFDILIGLPYRDLLNSCSTNQLFRNICRDDTFWYRKIYHDFDIDEIEFNEREDYRQLYQDLYSGQAYLPGMIFPANYPFEDAFKSALNKGDVNHGAALLEAGFNPDRALYLVVNSANGKYFNALLKRYYNVYLDKLDILALKLDDTALTHDIKSRISNQISNIRSYILDESFYWAIFYVEHGAMDWDNLNRITLKVRKLKENVDKIESIINDFTD